MKKGLFLTILISFSLLCQGITIGLRYEEVIGRYSFSKGETLCADPQDGQNTKIHVSLYKTAYINQYAVVDSVAVDYCGFAFYVIDTTIKNQMVQVSFYGGKTKGWVSIYDVLLFPLPIDRCPFALTYDETKAFIYNWENTPSAVHKIQARTAYADALYMRSRYEFYHDSPEQAIQTVSLAIGQSDMTLYYYWRSQYKRVLRDYYGAAIDAATAIDYFNSDMELAKNPLVQPFYHDVSDNFPAKIALLKADSEFNLGNYKEAIRLSSVSIGATTELDQDAYYILGRAQWRNGEFTKGCNTLQKAINLGHKEALTFSLLNCH